VLITRIEAEDNESIAVFFGIYSFPRFVLFGPNDSGVIAAEFSKSDRSLDELTKWIEKEVQNG
jgi:hypothetical protein